MPTLGETIRALYGAYRLARFDAGGMQYFDASLDGFWKSFFAAVIIAPLYFLLLMLRFQAGGSDAALPRFFSAEAIAYVIAWVLFPLLMLSIAKVLDREKNYLGYIIAYNWANVLQNGIYLPVAILAQTGVIPPDAGSALGLMLLLAILVYSWFIARTALDIPGPAAAALVALDLILGILVNGFAESMIR